MISFRNTLTPRDLDYVVRRLPRDVRKLLSDNPGRLFVGGGFIRATIAGETPNDVDLFGPNYMLAQVTASLLKDEREAKGSSTRIHKTDNAITVLSDGRLPVQFITRWTFNEAASLIASFDFTICQAAIWREPAGNWTSAVGEGFYIDLAGRRLVYTSPVREEEVGGSLMRVLKFQKRGYSIQVDSLGAVLARIFGKIRDSHMTANEADTGRVVTGLLREVDPLTVIDGLDMVQIDETEEA